MSRIYQVVTVPISEEEYITESDFFEHWFIPGIAWKVSSDTERDGDIQLLKERLAAVAKFDASESFKIKPGGKNIYFAKAYEAFVEARDKTVTMGLSEFSDGKSFLEAVGAMDTAFCDKFDFYVYSDSFDIIPLDEFIRCVKADETYYVGGTLKYDY